MRSQNFINIFVVTKEMMLSFDRFQCDLKKIGIAGRVCKENEIIVTKLRLVIQVTMCLNLLTWTSFLLIQSIHEFV